MQLSNGKHTIKHATTVNTKKPDQGIITLLFDAVFTNSMMHNAKVHTKTPGPLYESAKKNTHTIEINPVSRE